MTTYTATPSSAVNSTTLSGGDSLIVQSGGMADSDTLYDATAIVSSGGRASATTVENFGELTVLNGGTTDLTMLLDQGYETISSGGIASRTTVDQGAQAVSGGGLAIFTTLNSGAEQLVYSGTTSDSLIGSGAYEGLTGGIAVGTTVAAGGMLSAFAATLRNTLISGGADILASDGNAVASFTTIEAGGSETINGGSSDAATVGSFGVQIVDAGGSASGTTVTSGGTELIESGTATAISLQSGATEIVASGTASGTVVGSGVVVIVSSGATLTSAVLLSGGVIVKLPGAVVGVTGSSGGSVVTTGVVVYQPGSATTLAASSTGAAILGAGSDEYVLDGGTATGASFGTGATQTVYSGGVASGASVTAADGFQVISSGGHAIGTMLSSGGELIVSSGGIAHAIAVDEATVLVSGGTVSGGILSGTGYLHGSLGLDGGTASAITLGYGGDATISDGSLSGATVESGGDLSFDIFATGSGIVVSGGAVNVTTVIGSGTVISGTQVHGGSVEVGQGIANATIVFAGGEQDISLYGTADGTVLSSGGIEVAGGGIVSGTTVSSGGTQLIESGSATGTIIRQGGGAIVSAGAVASGAIVSAGGELVILPGGFASGTVSAGGAVVSTGVVTYQAATGITVYASGTSVSVGSGVQELVLSRGIASNTTVTNLGEQLVFSGGVASNTTLGGYLNVQAGIASGLTISSGGHANIGSGGRAFDVEVAGGGLIQGFGQTITSVTVSSGGEVDAYSGSLVSASVLAGGSASTESSGSASFVTVSNGGRFADGGTATGTVVMGGATEAVGGGGTDSGTVVNSGGTQDVYEQATAVGATISGGGLQFVQAGIASNSLILSGGSQIINQGTATSSHVGSGGIESLLDGTTSGTVVSAGGMEAISAGGTADGTILLAGGRMVVGTDAGGSITSGTVISSGASELVSSGSTAVGTILESGGRLVLLPGATESGTQFDGGTIVSTGVFDILSAGGVVVHGTLATGVTLGSGATEYVLAEGTAAGTTLASGATQIVFGSGIASGTVADDGSHLIVSGGVASNAVMSGGTGEIDAGGSALDTDVEAGTLFAVLSSGTASGTQVYSGGAEGAILGNVYDVTVHSGGLEAVFGIATDVTVQSGGALGLIAGATISAVIESGGAESVFSSNGIASGTQLDSGGVLVLLPGGLASGTVSAGGTVVSTGIVIYQVFSGTQLLGTSAIGPTITGGGQAYVLAGAVLSGGSISGGFDYIESLGADGVIPTELDVLNGGLASGVTVGSGAELSVEGVVSGGVVLAGGSLDVGTGGIDAGTLLSGGYMSVSSGGTASGVTVGRGGEFILSAGGAAPGLHLLQGSTLDLAELSIGEVNGETVAASDLLTVSNIYGSFDLALSGDYSGEFFNIAPDPTYDGALITVEGTPCYCRGTAILTDQGEVAVEALRIGDKLITRTGVARPIVWIGNRAYAGRFAAANPDVLPVRIRAGALGGGLPRRDLLVSPLHALFLDGVLIPAAALVNGSSIVREAAIERVEYFHVELETHDVILAEGAPAESFVDDDSRGMFHNAAEYLSRYPDAPRRPARYCAERVTDGPRLEAVRRLLARAEPETRLPGKLIGRLDDVRRTQISGWARDEAAPEDPVRLRILDSGVTIGEVLADHYRPDLEAAGFGRGCHGFVLDIAGGLSPLTDHVIQVQRVADGQDLPHSPWVLPASPPVLLPAPLTPVASLRGRVDTATRTQVSGWAQDEAAPNQPLEVQIIVNGVLAAQTLANRYRPDLERAGIGGGWHSFAVEFAGALSPVSRHVIEVRSARCGTLIAPPTVLEPAGSFDPDLEQAISRAVGALDDAAARDRAVAFLQAQTERLRRGARLVSARAKRALVIDERPPVVGRDGGSQAILSHMRALERLGYEVVLATEADAESVEDVVRREASLLDLVYLHRAGIAARYLALARHHAPRARIIYSVADLHHLRLERQAVVEERPELRAISRRMRLAECTASWSADAVITHSTSEAALLRRSVSDAQVYVVPWDLQPRRSAVNFGRRSGMAFIGNYAHAPNQDAARWLVEAVMPLVWQIDPTIECRLAGADITDVVQRLERPGVKILGQVDDLGAEVFDRVRLTVAPLRFGAGAKCKVLESFANATPCVMSENAADGLLLAPSLRSLVADDAAGLAALILRLHGDARAHRAASAAGLAMIRDSYSADGVEAALQEAIDGRRASGSLAVAAGRR